MQGKIVKGIAGFYYVYAQDDVLYECKARGILRSRHITPLVGDNVILEVYDHENNKGSIEDILPRNNSLIRPAVANVDQALIFFARNNPEPNMGLVDRLLITMENRGIDAMIAFNKADIGESDSLDLAAEKEAYRAAGYRVYDVSVAQHEGTDRIREQLQGHTTTLAGPSGAGKSSLINLLCPNADMETGDISEKLGRGRHTTRHAEILVIDHESFIVDTPGFTSYDISFIKAEELAGYYHEMDDYTGSCRFNTCTHTHEPDCAVRNAVEEGKISRLRYDRYARFYEELSRVRRY